MSTPSKISGSVVSASNDFSLALATMKNDFSLIKIEAPPEYNPLGSALNTRRRIEAEEGSQHKTARRLAALFDQYIPNTPKLVKAYGNRVSEIIHKPGVNPPGSRTHGAFEQYVGADGTAIWAAATSGVQALGLYLLACLLARKWETNEATAIWVELVVERRREVEKAFRENNAVSEASAMGALQDISRDDLARWDGSARAWLRSADEGKQWERDQLELVTKNLDLPFTSGSSMFQMVTSSWRRAMLGMEDLLNGRPQSITDASILLAFSAWHLYPDLIILRHETINVPFRDRLVPKSGVATIGLLSSEATGEHKMKWSLALSHLRYYGDPVQVESDDDDSRVSMEQLRLVAFGALLNAWRVNYRETRAVAEWFRSVWRILGQEKVEHANIGLDRQFAWLYVFYQAAETLLTCKTSPAVDDHHRLLQFGRRRGKDLFGEEYRRMPPYFGLSNPYRLAGLAEKRSTNCGLEYLRGIAQASGLESHEAFICCGHWMDEISALTWPDFYEYATAIPHKRSSNKRDFQGNAVLDGAHARWVHSRSSNALDNARERVENIKRHGEEAFLIEDGPTPSGQELDVLVWQVPPTLYLNKSASSCQGRCRCFEILATMASSPQFTCVLGDWRCGLFVSVSPEWHRTLAVENSKISGDVREAQAALATVSSASLWNYFCCLTGETSRVSLEKRLNTSILTAVVGLDLLADVNRLSGACLGTMLALSVANIVYKDLQGALISLRVVYHPLHPVSWLPEVPELKPLSTTQSTIRSNDSPRRPATAVSSNQPLIQPQVLPLPSRAQAFACITRMDSGALDVMPGDIQSVLAISSANSLYVAGVVLSDPAEPMVEYDIRRLVGNIGRPGISMLVAPQDPKIRPRKDGFKVVNHNPYDLKRENNFKGTSLHLSFTDWSFPLELGIDRAIDQQIHLVESVISVRDQGSWVADLDILGIDFSELAMLRQRQKCPEKHNEDCIYDYTSLDSWDDFLDSPETIGIFRAHGNWAARLAAVSILFQKNLGHCIGLFSSQDFCLKCLECQFTVDGMELDKYESHLPSYCID